MSDYRTSIRRSISYYRLKNYTTALQELNIAISRNKEYPYAYLLRYEIRRAMGEIEYGNDKDPDFLMWETLCKTWKFEK